MFGWQKGNSDSMEAKLREATHKRLVEVLGFPEEDFEADEASQQIPSKTVAKMNSEPELSDAC